MNMQGLKINHLNNHLMLLMLCFISLTGCSTHPDCHQLCKIQYQPSLFNHYYFQPMSATSVQPTHFLVSDYGACKLSHFKKEYGLSATKSTINKVNKAGKLCSCRASQKSNFRE